MPALHLALLYRPHTQTARTHHDPVSGCYHCHPIKEAVNSGIGRLWNVLQSQHLEEAKVGFEPQQPGSTAMVLALHHGVHYHCLLAQP